MRKLLLFCCLWLVAFSAVSARQPRLAAPAAPAAPDNAQPAARPFARPEPDTAADVPLLPLRRGTGGEAQAVAISGTLAYLGIGGQIEVLETGATSATLLTTLPVPNHVTTLAIEGDRLYAATGKGGLQIIDIQQPADPQIVGTYAPAGITRPSGVYGVVVRGTLGYVTRGNGYVEVLDLSDPTAPVKIKSLAVASGAFSMGAGQMVAGNSLLAVSSHKEEGGISSSWIGLYSLANPANPQMVGSIQHAPNDMAIEGTKLYTTNGSGFAAYDVSNPQQPVRLNPTGQEWDGSWAIDVAGTTLYVGNQLSLPDGTVDTIAAWDMSNPAEPELIATETVTDRPRQILAAGGRLYAPYGYNTTSGLLVLDLTATTLTMRESLPFPASPLEVRKVGSRLYVLDEFAGLFIYDINADSQMLLRGRHLPSGDPTVLMLGGGLQVRDDLAYVAYWHKDNRIFAIVDVSDPAQPTLVEQNIQPGSGVFAYQVALVGDYAYVGDMIYHVADPANLSDPVGTLGDIIISDVALVDSIAYIVSSKGLSIADVTHPQAPVFLGSIPTTDWFQAFTSVSVDKGFAYLTSLSGSITFVNAGNPAAPVVIGQYSTNHPGEHRAVDSAIYRGLLNIAIQTMDSDAYIQVVQITDPAHPVTVAETPVWGIPNRLLDDGESLYVAARQGGVVSLTNSIAARLVADPSGRMVNIVDFGFSAPSLTVRVGSSVTWANTGAVAHTTTSDQAGWDSGTLSGGQFFSRTFDTPGTFAYHCAIHPSMTGTITVAEFENKVFLPITTR